MESMGLDGSSGNNNYGGSGKKWEDTTPLWFGGGRIDAFAPEEDVFWGNESEWLKDERHEKRSAEDDSTGLEKPLGAVQMGLIYVNPVSSIMTLFFSAGYHHSLVPPYSS